VGTRRADIAGADEGYFSSSHGSRGVRGEGRCSHRRQTVDVEALQSASSQQSAVRQIVG
jgi:hypothetical protein